MFANLRKRITSRRHVGLHVQGETLYVCVASRLPLGHVSHESTEIPIEDGDLQAAFAAAVGDLGIARQSLSLAAGISIEDCYFATRPATSGATGASPRTLLRESLRCPNQSIERLTADVLHWQPQRRSVVGIAAAPREQVSAFMELTETSQIESLRVEPIAASMVRSAVAGDEPRSGPIARVILGRKELLAAVTVGDKAVCWQRHAMPAGDEATGIKAAIRSVITMCGPSGLDTEPDTVVIHGHRALEPLVDSADLAASIDLPVHWIDNQCLDDQSAAAALATGLLGEPIDCIDFARYQAQAPSLMRLFPYREAILYAAVVLATFVWLRQRNTDAQNRYDTLIAMAGPEVAQGKNPKNEKTQLTARANAFNTFLKDRVIWSRLVRDISARRPDQLLLTGIRGDSRMSDPRRGKSTGAANRSLVLQGTLPLSDDGSVPADLDVFVSDLKQLKSLTMDYPIVELADVQQTKKGRDESPQASFTILCSPKNKGKK